MCQHPEKYSYLTLREATTVALQILENGDGPSRPYECDCKRYHLTSKGMNGKPLTAEMVRSLSDAMGVSR
jgi:hypothetical protein